MNVVIGASGFLGSHLLCHLAQGNEKVRAIFRNQQSIQATKQYLKYYNLPSDYLNEKVDWIQADILDFESLSLALQDSSYVYNCSGYVSFDKRDKNKMIAVNVKGTSNIVNICLQNNCKKLIHVSSIAALGESDANELITEETQWLRTKSESWYSITKFNAETEAWRGIAEGLSTVIVNPSVILGPGNWNQGSPKLFKTVHDGLKYYTKGVVGYVDVRDVCRAMIQLMQSSIEGERFIVSGFNQTYQEVFTEIAKSIKKPLPTRNASPAILSIAWRFDLIRSTVLSTKPLITRNTARTAMKQSFYSSQKLIDALMFEFKSFHETVGYTGKCFLDDLSN